MARKLQTRSESLIGGQTWGEFWPPLERHLYGVLRHRLPPGSDLAGFVQETAFRLLRCPKDFGGPDHAAKEATQIAVNLARDARRRARLIAFGDLPSEPASSDNVERAVVDADELIRLRKLAVLRSVDLDSLIDLKSDPDYRSEASKSRRYRARKLVRQWREAAGAILAFPKLRWLLGAATATAAVVPGAMPYVDRHFSDVPAVAAPEEPGVATALPAVGLDTGPEQPGSEAVPSAARTGQRGITQAEVGPTYKPQVEVRGPAGTGVDKGTQEYPPGEEPACLAYVNRADPLPDVCVPHPQRG